MDVLTNLIVVIILQYIIIPNHHIVHLKLIHCYMSIISQYSQKKIKIKGYISEKITSAKLFHKVQK